MLRVFIGDDPREQAAVDVALSSLLRHAGTDLDVTLLNASRLASRGLLRRPVDTRGGQIYDIVSNAPCATEFSNSRFLVPILCQTGWALFVDCDVVFLADIVDLFKLADPSKAVMVVKHDHRPTLETKMGGHAQTRYSRKNWSSVCLFNCDHPANARLTLEDVNARPGRDLHAFYWLHDAEIGELPARWNWLVNEQPMPADPGIAHFTNGGPWIEGWGGAPFDDLWQDAAGRRA